MSAADSSFLRANACVRVEISVDGALLNGPDDCSSLTEVVSQYRPRELDVTLRPEVSGQHATLFTLPASVSYKLTRFEPEGDRLRLRYQLDDPDA